MPHMPQKGEDHRSNHMTTKSKRKKREKRRRGKMRKETHSNGEQREVAGEEGGNPSINHTTLKTSNHMTIIWSPPTHEKHKATGTHTRGLRPAHETARTLRHHYERKSCERVKDAYSIPHPVPPKITPRARMVPATAPISLLVATLTVQREKEHYYHPVKNKQQASASESWIK